MECEKIARLHAKHAFSHLILKRKSWCEIMVCLTARVRVVRSCSLCWSSLVRIVADPKSRCSAISVGTWCGCLSFSLSNSLFLVDSSFGLILDELHVLCWKFDELYPLYNIFEKKWKSTNQTKIKKKNRKMNLTERSLLISCVWQSNDKSAT